MSRVGNKPISIPEKVTVKKDEAGHITVEGPKGKLEWDIPASISMQQEDGVLTFVRADEGRRTRALHGTARAILQNMILGVSQGFTRDLEIRGVGFRAAVKGNELDLNLGYSHEVKQAIPEGVKVTVADNTKIKVEGIDKQIVGQFASNVRSWYPPEPYKGKGVHYVGEYVRRKAGKTTK